MTTTDLTSLNDAELAAEIRQRHVALYDVVGVAETRGLKVTLDQQTSTEIGSGRRTYYTTAEVERITVEKL